MVEVKYKGKTGNNLFQYCFGRIIAEELGWKLSAPSINGFPNTAKNISGQDYSHGYPIKELRGQKIDMTKLLSSPEKRKIIINGYFQKYPYYAKYADKIKNDWLVFGSKYIPKFTIKPDDVLVCVRRDDYVPFHALPWSYYEDALSQVKHQRVFLCFQSYDPFISLLKRRFNAHCITGPPLETLQCITQFKKIIISNSSFHWWGAFLSKATEIIAPIPVQGFWSAQMGYIDLKTDCEKRFKFINCQEAYRESLLEKLLTYKREILK